MSLRAAAAHCARLVSTVPFATLRPFPAWVVTSFRSVDFAPARVHST